MDLTLLAQKAHDNAVKHGFWDDKLSDEHFLMLIITEISEAVEAHRQNRTADMSHKSTICIADKINTTEFELYIKDSLQDELADTAIRLLDLAGRHCINFGLMKPCGYVRAFDNYTFTENAFALVRGLSRDYISIVKRIQFGLHYLQSWCESLNINLELHIDYKMKYNATRPIRHGKKY